MSVRVVLRTLHRRANVQTWSLRLGALSARYVADQWQSLTHTSLSFRVWEA